MKYFIFFVLFVSCTFRYFEPNQCSEFSELYYSGCWVGTCRPRLSGNILKVVSRSFKRLDHVIFWQVHIYGIICYNLVLLYTFMMKPTQRLRQQVVGMPSLSLHSIEDVVPMPFCASFLLWDVDAFLHWGMFQDARVSFDQWTHGIFGLVW